MLVLPTAFQQSRLLGPQPQPHRLSGRPSAFPSSPGIVPQGPTRITHQEGLLSLIGALDAFGVELPLLEAALHDAHSTGHSPLEILERSSWEAQLQLVAQDLPVERRQPQTIFFGAGRRQDQGPGVATSPLPLSTLARKAKLASLLRGLCRICRAKQAPCCPPLCDINSALRHRKSLSQATRSRK